MEKNKKISYILACSAVAFLAYAAHEVRQHKAGETPQGLEQLASKAEKPNANWIPNDTLTGNILAANFAQSQQDWTLANEYLDRITNKESKDPRTLKRMMLLAMSAGEFDAAVEYAQTIQGVTKASANTAQDHAYDSIGDAQDLASLIIMAKSIKAGDFTAAEKSLMTVQSSALKGFVQPVIMSWLNASEHKKVGSIADHTSLLQALHKGLAAELSGQKKEADQIFDVISQAALTPQGYKTVAAYNIRNNRLEKARAVLKQGLILNPHITALKKIENSLAAGKAPVPLPELAYHMQGVTAGVAMAFRDLAQMMLEAGATDSALVFAQMGRFIRSDVPSLSLLVGDVFVSQKRYSDAANAFLSVQPTEGDYTDGQIKLSELRGIEGQKEEAIKILERVQENTPSARLYYALGELYRANKDSAKAVAAYSKAIENGADDLGDDIWSVYFVRAMALDETGEWEKAEADLKKALEFQPKNPNILNYLGYSWADKNINLAEAYKMLLTAITLQPNDPYITDSLGWVYYKKNRFEDATVLLERAVSLKPYDPVMNEHLGDVYAKTGRTLEAQYQWQRALDYAEQEKDEKLIKALKEKLGQ
jgi:tetratricopeptide (TPR) repeat protein